jgi:uncharacterized protein (DUF2141 family)
MKAVFYFFLALILPSCASRVAPSGGAPDKSPPKIASVNPASGSTQFSSDRLEVTFDEFIALKDGGSGILISPPLKTPPEAILKGKTLQLRFKENFLENTTYTLTLGPSVTDITESNPLEETQLVFSTGPQLDTLKFTGRVENAYTNLAPKSAVVALYEAFHDSVPQNQLPRYFARTTASGSFTINNVKAGKYRMLAFEDANSDMKLSLPDETVAFAADTIRIDSGTLSNGTLRLFKNKPNRQRLVRSKFDAPGRITLKYAFAPEKLEFESVGSTDIAKLLNTSNSQSDSITLWYNAKGIDSLKFIAKAFSGDSLHRDTVSFATKKSGSIAGKGKNKKTAAADTSIQITLNAFQNKLVAGDSLKLRFSAPLADTVVGKIVCIYNNDTLRLSPIVDQGEKMQRVYVLPKPNQNFTLKIERGIFTDIFGRGCDSLRQSISYYTEDDLGNLDFIFRNDSVNGFVGVFQLLDKGGTVLKSQKVSTTETLQFKSLSPGEYSVCLIGDNDGNTQWTSGDFATRKQPERMYYFAEKFTVRAGWDLELEWEPLQTSNRKKNLK